MVSVGSTSTLDGDIGREKVQATVADEASMNLKAPGKVPKLISLENSSTKPFWT